jgi:hypothetical protein
MKVKKRLFYFTHLFCRASTSFRCGISLSPPIYWPSACAGARASLVPVKGELRRRSLSDGIPPSVIPCQGFLIRSAQEKL